MAITDEEIRVTIKALASKGPAKGGIARLLSLREGTAHYHLRRIAAKVTYGRARQVRRASVHQDAIVHWMSTHDERVT